MKKLFLLLLTSFSLFAQNSTKEFEGIIKYNHKVIAKESTYNVDYDYSAIGKNSEYYYKNGDYKFVNHDCYFKADLFKSKELNNYLVLDKSDTVFVVNSRITDVQIVDFTIKKSAETILGYSCNVLTLTLKPTDKDGPISYRRYYFSKQLSINPEHFKLCKGNAYDFIFEKAKALPLKIEFEWPNRTIVWDAYEVKKQPLKDDLFEKQANWIPMNVN